MTDEELQQLWREASIAAGEAHTNYPSAGVLAKFVVLLTAKLQINTII